MDGRRRDRKEGKEGGKRMDREQEREGEVQKQRNKQLNLHTHQQTQHHNRLTSNMFLIRCKIHLPMFFMVTMMLTCALQSHWKPSTRHSGGPSRGIILTTVDALRHSSGQVLVSAEHILL